MVEGTVNVSFKKAVNAARFIIKSRTGLAIVKKSYQEKVDPISIKNSHLLKGFQEKKMRKLERDRTQFANDQTEKFNNDKVSESFFSKPTMKNTQQINNKRMQRSRIELQQSTKYETDAVIYRRDFIPTFDKRSKLAWEDDEKITENKKEFEKTPILTRKKVLDHNMNSYTEDKRLELWLNQVEIANIERKETSMGRNKKKRKQQIDQGNSSSQQKLILPKCYDGKPQSCASKLELPTISEQSKSRSQSIVNLPKLCQSNTPDSRDEKTKVDDSLTDPRFTRLIDSLTPSKNDLKLPQILAKPSSRSS